MKEFSTYLDVRGKTNTGPITLEQLESKIQNNPNSDLIESYRIDKNSNIKISIPIITPHGIFRNGQKNDKSLIELSGLVTIDLDRPGQEDKNILETLPEVIGVWKSISGTGLHAIASLDGLNSDNFRLYHLAYLNSLKANYGIVADNKVCSIQSGLIISSDIDVKFNYNYKSLNVEELDNFIPNNKKRQTNSNILDANELTSITIGLTFLRFQLTLNEYSSNIMYFREGLPFFKVYLPYDSNGRPCKIANGSRNTILSSYLHNLICLNLGSTYEMILKWMTHMNLDFCINPLSEKDLVKLIKNKWDSRYELKPIDVIIKKYWINPQYKEDKKKLYHNFKLEYKEGVINDWFESELPTYNCKITQEIIARDTGFSRTTISDFIRSEHREAIKHHNKQIKNKK